MKRTLSAKSLEPRAPIMISILFDLKISKFQEMNQFVSSWELEVSRALIEFVKTQLLGGWPLRSRWKSHEQIIKFHTNYYYLSRSYKIVWIILRLDDILRLFSWFGKAELRIPGWISSYGAYKTYRGFGKRPARLIEDEEKLSSKKYMSSVGKKRAVSPGAFNDKYWPTVL